MKKTGIIAVRLEPDLMASVEEQADREDRPLGMMARILIKEAIAVRKAKEESADRKKGR